LVLVPNPSILLSRPSYLRHTVSSILVLSAFFVLTLFFTTLFSSELRAASRNQPFAPPVSEPVTSAQSCKIIYAGFVGALETSNHKHSGVVQIRDTLRGADFPDVCADSFMPISWTSGRDWILTHFPSHTGVLTESELENAPRIILVGHSTGGWAMLSVARDLRDKGIPVELTVQIDSVGFTDYTIPKNVSTGAIFHAWDALMFMTTKHIHMEDPSHTKLIADVLVKDASHLSITRDPRIRRLVLDAVSKLRQQIAALSAPGTQ
jgi:hypothetical protein